MKFNHLKKICILACLLIVPLITLNLALQSDLLKYNFTHFSSLDNTKSIYYLWAFVTTTTASVSIYIIIKKYKLIKPTNNQIISLFFILFGSSLIPYSKYNNFLSFIHVFFAYIALMYFNYILFISYSYMKINNIEINKHLNAYILQLTICFLLSSYYGSINSLVEVIYTISTSLIFASLLMQNKSRK